GLCTGPQEGARALVLTFDNEGVLRSFHIEEQGGSLWTGPPSQDWLVRRLGMLQPFPTGPVLVPSTQPVTIPPGVPGPVGPPPAAGGPLPPDPVPGRATAPSAPLPPDAVPYRTP